MEHTSPNVHEQTISGVEFAAHKDMKAAMETPGQCSWKSNGRLCFFAEWHSIESADQTEVQRNRCTCNRPTETANTSTVAPSASKDTCTSHSKWGRLCCPTQRRPTQIYGYIYFFVQRWVFQLWHVSQGSQTWSRLHSSFADWWRNIHWCEHYRLCGNAADIPFATDSSISSDTVTEDKHR